MQIVVNGLVTHYEKRGTGKLIVFLHGWADRLQTFDGLFQGLAENYECIALDLPGFGQTEAPTEAWKLDDYANFLKAFLTKLEKKQVYAVIGHSNGGAVAIKALADAYIEPSKLVLLAASGVRNTKGVRRMGLKVVAKTGKAMTFWLPLKTRQGLQKKLYGTISSDMLVAPHMKETFKQTVRQDIQAEAATLTMPVLMIYGDGDQATPVQSVALPLQQAIPDADLKILHGADHFVHHSHRQQVYQLIEDFLKT